MKLHLNLTLRRALMAAMAMVALHTADAAMTTHHNGQHAYIYGDGALTSKAWNDVWSKHKSSTLTIGNYLGSSVAELEGSTYNHGGDIYLGGVGYDSNKTTANNGELIVNKKTSLNLNSLNIGNSQVGGVGTLTMNGGTVTLDSSLFVGVNQGSGVVNATGGASIVLKSGAAGANFTMSHRSVAGLSDTATLTGSSITVGTTGGVKDYTSIGHSAGVATLNLDNSRASFADQTIVGEKGGSNGTIHVHNGSSLSMNIVELGYAAGATGFICVEGGTVSADAVTVGNAGQGTMTVDAGSSLKADSIILGSAATGNGTLSSFGSITTGIVEVGNAGNGSLNIDGGTLTATSITAGDAAGSHGIVNVAVGAKVSASLVTVGDAGNGSMINAGSLTTTDMVVGNTGSGIVSTTGAITAGTLWVGYMGTGSVSVDGGTLSAGDTYITGTQSVLNTEVGTTSLQKATVLAGRLSTDEGGKTQISGELILDEAASLLNAGTTELNTATVSSGSSIASVSGRVSAKSIVNSGIIANDSDSALAVDSLTNYHNVTNLGEATTGSLSNTGTISNSGTWTMKGETTSTVGSIDNNGIVNVAGSLTTDTFSGTGITNVLSGGSWAITGQTNQDTIDNAGTITLTGAGHIVTTNFTGTGTTTLTLDATTVATAGGTAIIEAVNPVASDNIKVDIDTDNGSSLVGKTFNFVKDGGILLELNADNFMVDSGWSIDWGKSCITSGTDANGKQLSFTGGVDTMTFTRMGAIETQQVEVETSSNVTIEIEVLTETVQAETATPEAMGTTVIKPEDLTAEEQQLATDVKVENDTTIHTAEISTGVDKETQQEVRTNVVIGKDVTTTVENGAVKVQSVTINQKTTIDREGEHEDEVHKESLGVGGIALVLNGKSEHKGTGKDSGAELGFNENTKEGILAVKDNETDTVIKNEVKKIDLVNVEEQSEVSISQMDMHTTHAFTVASGSTVTFDNVNLHVGGTTDVNLTKEVEVKVYDEDGKVVGTKKETVDTGAHLTVDSTITQATVKITGESEVKFEKIDDDSHHSFGSTTFEASSVEIDAGSSLGESAEHMQEIVFTKETEVKNSGNVNKAKFDNGSKLHNNNGTVNDVVISNGSHLTGKGNLKKVHVDKDSYLTVGSSPGKFTAEELTVDGKTSFYIITNSDDWKGYTGDSSQLTADELDTTTGKFGAISQLEVVGNVSLNNQVTFIYQAYDSNTGEFVTVDTATARAEMKDYFAEGYSIKFVDIKDGGSITLGSGFSVDTASLPELKEGLFWDVSSLFTDYTVTVIAEILEEPTRVANSLVSAGETVLNFGRLAQAQADLREAGTTRTWASAIAMFDSIDTGSTTNGYDYSNWGAAVGVDHAFTRNTVLGIAFGCTWGENEAKEDNGYYSAGSIDQDAKMIGIYGVHKFQTKGLLNDVKLNAFAAYGWFENDSSRKGHNSGHTAKAEWDSDAWVLSASLSRDITTDNDVVFTPYVGVEYTKAGMDDFTEKGKSYTADYSADDDYSNLAVKVGVTVSKNYGGFAPYVGIAYIGDVDRNAAEVTANGKRNYTGKSALPGRDALQLKVGANVQLTETLDVFAGYSAEIRNKATEHNANVGVGLTF